jgi:hypothetical protein
MVGKEGRVLYESRYGLSANGFNTLARYTYMLDCRNMNTARVSPGQI